MEPFCLKCDAIISTPRGRGLVLHLARAHRELLRENTNREYLLCCCGFSSHDIKSMVDHLGEDPWLHFAEQRLRDRPGLSGGPVNSVIVETR